MLRSSAWLCPALLQLLPQAVDLVEHSVRISKLLLPLVAKPAKGGPLPLFALSEALDQFIVDLGRGSPLPIRRRALPRLVSQAELF